MYNYAKDVTELSQKDFSGAKKVKIRAERGLKFGYPHAKNSKGFVVEERMLPNNTPAYKVFTGTRIWTVPQDDCQEI